MEKLVEFTQLAKQSSYVEELEKGIKFLKEALNDEINKEMACKTKQRLNTHFPDFREITEFICRIETEDEYLGVYCRINHKAHIEYRGISFCFQKYYLGDDYYAYKMEDIYVSITVTTACSVFLQNINLYLREDGKISDGDVKKLLRYLSVPNDDDNEIEEYENDDDYVNHKMKDSVLDYVRVMLNCGELCEKYP